MIASVLIVNYNGGSKLAACLAALELQSIPRDEFEVIVVDNASADESLSLAEKLYPNSCFIRLRHNVGFAEGNNIAAREATSDTLVLLNNDTLPDPFWLEELLLVLHEKQAAAAVSKLVFAHDASIINSAGLQLLRDGRGADRGFRRQDRGEYEVTREVFAGCGAALAVKRTHLGDVLDGSLFLYYEDLDAAWHRPANGLATWYAPRSLVRHAVGAAEASPVHRFYVERNRVLTAVRHADLPLAIYSLLVLSLKVPQAVLKSLRGRQSWRTTLAVPKAFLAVIGNLPEAVVQRYMNRSWRVR